MKVYLLWYIQPDWNSPKVISALRDYYKAEEVAQNLEFLLKIVVGEKGEFQIGVTRTLMNKIHLDPREESSTWVLYDKGEWFLEGE